MKFRFSLAPFILLATLLPVCNYAQNLKAVRQRMSQRIQDVSKGAKLSQAEIAEAFKIANIDDLVNSSTACLLLVSAVHTNQLDQGKLLTFLEAKLSRIPASDSFIPATNYMATLQIHRPTQTLVEIGRKNNVSHFRAHLSPAEMKYVENCATSSLVSDRVNIIRFVLSKEIYTPKQRAFVLKQLGPMKTTSKEEKLFHSCALRVLKKRWK